MQQQASAKKRLVLLPPSFHEVCIDQLTEEQFSSACQYHTTCGVTGFTILQEVLWQINKLNWFIQQTDTQT